MSMIMGRLVYCLHMDRITIPALAEMKRQGRKIVAVVAWEAVMAELAQRAGVDMLSVGDSVGEKLWGPATENEGAIEGMLGVCKAGAAGAKRPPASSRGSAPAAPPPP